MLFQDSNLLQVKVTLRLSLGTEHIGIEKIVRCSFHPEYRSRYTKTDTAGIETTCPNTCKMFDDNWIELET